MSRISIAVAALLTALGFSLARQVPVSMVDFAFSPDTVRVNPGDSVIWTNNGTFVHTSTSGVNGVPDGLWNSGDMPHGVTYVRAFPANGTFNYYCTHHYLSGMKGVVVVGASGVNEAPGTAGNTPSIAGFPNPFISATTLRLAPSGAGRGGIRIFNASGKLVRKLEATDGSFVVWDGTDDHGHETGPGVYFCEYGSSSLAVTLLR